MQNIIQLLPEALANQIAAGEVVQRPSSVLKEMLENALDAGATDIRVVIKDGGSTLIQVIDNGKGMSDIDARLCFERHATSKIHKSEDLFDIHTYGFRGEAMASIAAVAQVELKTRMHEDEIGTFLYIEGSEIRKQEETICNTGTSISVKNLFYNVPARRKFLKSQNVELKHLLETFQIISLANASVNFRFTHNEKEILQLKEGNLARRILGIFGKNYQKVLMPCQENIQNLNIQGYLGKPELSKKSRGEQFLFVNNRFIKSPLLHSAIMRAYDRLLPQDTYPFYVLFLEVPYDQVDVNVHPAKTEIKFEDEKAVYALVHAAARKALGVFQMHSSIDFEADVNYGHPSSSNKNLQELNKTDLPKEFQGYISPQFHAQRIQRSSWEKHFEGLEKQTESRSAPEQLNFSREESNEDSLWNEILPSQMNDTAVQAVSFDDKDSFIFVAPCYILLSTQEGLMVIDQIGALFRIYYERFLQKLSASRLSSQHLLFPEKLTLGASKFLTLEPYFSIFEQMGFLFSSTEDHSIEIQGIPADIPHVRMDELFDQLYEQIESGSDPNIQHFREQMCIRMAKKSAYQEAIHRDKEALHNLMQHLFNCEQSAYTPEGERIYKNIEGMEIGRWLLS